MNVKYINSSLTFEAAEIPDVQDVTETWAKTAGRLTADGRVYTNESYVYTHVITSGELRKYRFENLSINNRRNTEYLYQAYDESNVMIADYSSLAVEPNKVLEDSGIITFPANTYKILVMTRNAYADQIKIYKYNV